MDFKKATDELCKALTAADIAKALKRPEQSIRQARASSESSGHRPPPDGWQAGVAKLARARADRLLNLADQLEGKR